jgi:hypothetical protein
VLDEAAFSCATVVGVEEAPVAELKDFSSFDPMVETTFVPYERSMRDNEKRAYTIGFGFAGGLFVVASLVVAFLYTPCSNFCSRAPGSCKSESDIAKWKSNCENACAQLEHSSGLRIVREEKDEKSGKMNSTTEEVSGQAYVQTLAACAFSGGGGATCEGVVKTATERGLWCAEAK